MTLEKTLCDVRPGQRAKIKQVNHCGSIRRRLLDIGLVNGTTVECVGKSPCGDPTAFLIRGAVIAIRSEDCQKIAVSDISCKTGGV